jgi:hypothetical protein
VITTSEVTGEAKVKGQHVDQIAQIDTFTL